jgi:hypothetical protein
MGRCQEMQCNRYDICSGGNTLAIRSKILQRRGVPSCHGAILPLKLGVINLGSFTFFLQKLKDLSIFLVKIRIFTFFDWIMTEMRIVGGQYSTYVYIRWQCAVAHTTLQIYSSLESYINSSEAFSCHCKLTQSIPTVREISLSGTASGQ